MNNAPPYFTADSTSHILSTRLHQMPCPYQCDPGFMLQQKTTPLSPKSPTEFRGGTMQWHALFPAEVDSPIRVTTTAQSDTYRTILQQWEGVVTDITESTFCANLIDLTDPSNPEEMVELSLDEISWADKEILVAGSIFYWTISHAWSPGGQKSRVSEIRLQRTPRWSKNTLARLQEQAQSYMKDLNVQPDTISADPK